MATFEEQIEAISGLTIIESSTVPTQTQLTQFLKDGIVEVINRLAVAKPEVMVLFSTSVDIADNSGTLIDNGLLISVMRADGTSADNLYPCGKVSVENRYRATDTTSLEYRSVYNPGFYVKDQKVYIVPAPTNNTTNKGVITYVDYQNITYSQSSIPNFPKSYEYLVMLYGAIRSIESKMAEFAITEEDAELVQIIQANLISVQQQYNQAFALSVPPSEEQMSGINRRQGEE